MIVKLTEEDLKSPSENTRFTEYWDMLIGDILDRDNLKRSHLKQLSVLCNLFIEYDELNETILNHGRTYESMGRNGLQIKMRPEVAQMSKVVTQIKDYSKMLGLILYKDNTITKDKDKNEFDY